MRPLLPREHGAWAILAVSLFAGTRNGGGDPGAVLLLVGASFLLFMAFAVNANALGRRRDARRHVARWRLLYALAGAACGAPLLLLHRRWELLPLIVLAALLVLLREAAVRRLEGSRHPPPVDEIASTSILCLAAPAGYAVGTGRLDGEAWLLGAVCFLFFAGGVLHVRMLIDAARLRPLGRGELRRRVGRPALLYHGAALALLPLALLARPAGVVALWSVPFLLAAGRTLLAWRRLGGPTPRLKVVGWWEVVYALVFAAAMAAPAKSAEGWHG